MRKNCMAEVAKLLGVELEEVFCIDGDEHYFRLTDTGLGMKIGSDNRNWFAAPINALNGLLLGENEIIKIKLPWRPQEDERYYYPLPSDKDLWGGTTWSDNNYDNIRLSRGLVFKTIEEAVAVAEKMLEAINEQQAKGLALSWPCIFSLLL